MFDIHHKFRPVVKRFLSRLEGKIQLHVMMDCIADRKVETAYYPTKTYLHTTWDLPSIEHEIAHMVEVSESRILIPDWGFRFYTDIYPANTKGKTTTAALVAAMSRETRVRAIQRLIDGGNAEQSSLAQNFMWLDALQARLPFGRFKNRKDIIDWIEDMHLKTYVNWNIDRIEVEWNRKVDILLDWMETKDTPTHGMV